ncbi:MAG: hypothetical protein R3362_07880 [Rhodothermales bacterium]|nr:hypothetical protein [Rhodothermales bacterium]
MWWLNLRYLRGPAGRIRVGQLVLAYVVLGAHTLLAACRTVLGLPLLLLGLVSGSRGAARPAGGSKKKEAS